LVVVNGEIFNWKRLVVSLELRLADGASDCAVVSALLERGLTLAEVARQLDGDFAIVVVGEDTVEMCRDPYGVRPLYWGTCDGQWTGVVSEIKGFPSGANEIRAIEPGTVVSNQHKTSLTSLTWHQVPWLKIPAWRASLEGLAAGGETLKEALIEAVDKRLSTVRAVGACLSGGLDSSLVAALAARRVPSLHTYSIGMVDSPDLAFAREVAAHIGSIHHERILTAEECIAAVPDVIRAIESFDITTVRASVGNYLLGRFIAEITPDVKVVLNGDGADELLGGYLYMRAAPDDVAFETEIDRLMREIHMFDVARSERSMAAHGLESRSPFLDRQVVAVARGLPTSALRPSDAHIEKAILRTAFAKDGLLPSSVLWRRKEAFSDGISRSDSVPWFKRVGSECTTDAFIVNPPTTSEARLYRELWAAQFPEAAANAVAPHMWMPRWVNTVDPSARTLADMYSA